MRKLHFMNASNRDARVIMSSLKYRQPHQMGAPGKNIKFMRYLAAGGNGLHDYLVGDIGDDYGQELVDTDPEIDLETIGRIITGTDVVYLSGSGDILFSPPRIMEIILAPDGTEKERREPKDVPANVDEEHPVRWTGKKMPKEKVVLKFIFRKTIQLRHIDGLTYDYLYTIAKEFHDEGVMVLIGAGKDGKAPLIFQTNGSPHRGFLEGRVDGKKYQLLLHLSNMEVKKPVESQRNQK